MQIQKVNANHSKQPNFQALHMASYKKVLNGGKECITDIYSLNKKDYEFIEMFLSCIGNKNPKDKLAIGGDVKTIMREVLNKAKNLPLDITGNTKQEKIKRQFYPNIDKKVFMAVEDNKKITGLMDFFHIPVRSLQLDKITTWQVNNGSDTRKSLILSLLDFAKKNKYSSIVVRDKDCSNSNLKFLQKTGFNKSKMLHDFYMYRMNYSRYSNKISENSMLIKRDIPNKEVNLMNLFDL